MRVVYIEAVESENLLAIECETAPPAGMLVHIKNEPGPGAGPRYRVLSSEWYARSSSDGSGRTEVFVYVVAI